MTVHTLFPDRAIPLEPDPCAPGEVLSGSYTVLRRIGWGSMGVVYEGSAVDTGKRVALKVLHPILAGEARGVEHLQQQARTVSGLRHPGIVELIDLAETDEGLPALVTEYLKGEGLLDRLARCAPLEPDDAIAIVMQVVAALGAAHEAGVAHLALKPENVLLTSGPLGLDRVKVLDWGFAGYTKHTPARPDPLATTVAYQSPEQSSGRATDARTDLYAVGVMLYEMLSANLPYRGDAYQVIAAMAGEDPVPLEELEPSIPPELAAIVGKAMRRDRHERFQTAGELEEALGRMRKTRSPRLAVPTLRDTLGPIPEEDRDFSPPSSNTTWAIILLLALDGGGLLAHATMRDPFEAERIELVEPAEPLAPRPGLRITRAPLSPPARLPATVRAGRGVTRRWTPPWRRARTWRSPFSPHVNYGGPPSRARR